MPQCWSEGKDLTEQQCIAMKIPCEKVNTSCCGRTCCKGDDLTGGAVAVQVSADNTGIVILPTAQTLHQAGGAHCITAVRVSINIYSNGDVEYHPDARCPVEYCRILAAADGHRQVGRCAGNWRNGNY